MSNIKGFTKELIVFNFFQNNEILFFMLILYDMGMNLKKIKQEHGREK